ncbi:hypothetical protein HDU93_007980 [Gonapodya sp. JEL0774]|nr:hypothetical protein HDU93_007980 [Gonapodya sp. JEL0774]
MDSLPPELLHRVFRLVPPRDFYGTIPLVSRRFRRDAVGALPGCPGNGIGIACEIEITDAGDDLDADEYPQHWLDPNPIRFCTEFRRAQSPSASGGVIWTSMAPVTVLRLSAKRIIPRGSTLDVQDVMDCLFTQERRQKSIPRDQVHVAVSKMTICISYIVSDDSFSAVVDFIREQGVEDLDLATLHAMDLLKRLPDDIQLESITSLTSPQIIEASSFGSERATIMSGTVLDRFPSVVSVMGVAFYPVKGIRELTEDVVRRNLSETFRRRVTSLVVPHRPNWSLPPASGPFMRLRLLRAIVVYPSLQELGVLSLFDSMLSWEELTSEPLTTDALCALGQLRKLQLRIDATNVDYAPSPQHGVNLAEKLALTLPGLRRVLVTITGHVRFTMLTVGDVNHEPPVLPRFLNALMRPSASALRRSPSFSGQDHDSEPNRTGIFTLGIDSLPLEVLQRVFRLLEPRDFYGTIPLVSRRFRGGSLPGCPGNSIGIACHVLITDIRQHVERSGAEPLHPITFETEFQSTQGPSSRAIWTAMAPLTGLRLSMNRILPRGSTLDVRTLMDNLFAEERHFNSIPRERVLVVVSKLLSSSPPSVATTVFALPDEVQLESIVSLTSPRSIAAFTFGSERAAMVRTLLHRFPAVLSVSGDLFYPLNGPGDLSKDYVLEMMPEKFRRNVTTLDIPCPMSGNAVVHGGPTIRLQLLRAISVYPALQDLGVLELFSSRISWEKLTESPLSTDVQRALAKLRKLHLRIDAAGIDYVPRPQHAVTLAKTLAQTFPGLQSVDVDINKNFSHILHPFGEPNYTPPPSPVATTNMKTNKNRRDIFTSRVDSLPLEILHRVFRLLPPRVVYGTIPLLSRRFRDAALGAIPGCPGNAVGIACQVLVSDALFGHAPCSRSPGIPFLDEFLEVRTPSDGVLWAAVSPLSTLSFPAKLIAQSNMQLALLNTIIECFFAEQRGFQCIPRPRAQVITLKVSIELNNSGRNAKDALRNVLDFVREQRVREFELSTLNAMTLLDELKQDIKLESVVSLTSPESIAVWKYDLRLSNLLPRFPSATSLSGLLFYPVTLNNESAEYLVQRAIPETRRRMVKSLMVPIPQFGPASPNSGPFIRRQILHAISVYPALREIGLLSLFNSNLAWEEFISSPLPDTSHRALAQIRKLHLRIDAMDIDAAPSAQHTSILAETLTRTLPGLESLIIKIVNIPDHPLNIFFSRSAKDPMLPRFLDALLGTTARANLHSSCCEYVFEPITRSQFSSPLQTYASDKYWPRDLKDWNGRSRIVIVKKGLSAR